MKGTISENLEAILRDDQGRRRLRRSLIAGKDSEITVGRTKYRVSTKSKATLRSRASGKLTMRRSVSSKRTAG
jgi:hypothetical protein